MLTDSQLKAALHFVDSLADLIQDSNKTIQRKKAQKKLETLPEYQAQMDQSANRPSENAQTSAQRMFSIFDVRETSYHFFSQRIDLHLCDDAGSKMKILILYLRNATKLFGLFLFQMEDHLILI